MVSDWKEATVNDVHTMTSKANLSRRFSNVIIGLHSVGAFTYGIGVLVSHTDDHDADAIETPVRMQREFTLKMQLPFECNESPLYELVMCLEFLHQLASSAVTGILNSLIVTLVSEICKKKFLFSRLLFLLYVTNYNINGVIYLFVWHLYLLVMRYSCLILKFSLEYLFRKAFWKKCFRQRLYDLKGIVSNQLIKFGSDAP